MDVNLLGLEDFFVAFQATVVVFAQDDELLDGRVPIDTVASGDGVLRVNEGATAPMLQAGRVQKFHLPRPGIGFRGLPTNDALLAGMFVPVRMGSTS